jgi:pyrroloquinoline quinone biosynthesis protein B
VFVRILGSGAGGGLPQWNCGCPGCDAARSGRIPRRAETCVAVASEKGAPCWLIVGAPAVVATLVAADVDLAPRSTRGTRVGAVALVYGDLDQTLGLLTLREWESLRIMSTRTVQRGFREGNTLVRTLTRVPGQLAWITLVPGRESIVPGDQGLRVEAIPVRGKVPLHLEGQAGANDEQNVALLVTDARGRSLAVAPSVGGDGPAVRRILDHADVVLFDGTCWWDDELVRLGIGARTAREMGHWPLAGPGGSLEVLLSRRPRRTVLVHVNNTNPILLPGPERDALDEAGVELAFDGMELGA